MIAQILPAHQISEHSVQRFEKRHFFWATLLLILAAGSNLLAYGTPWVKMQLLFLNRFSIG
jgi:hypothetical protein